MKHPLLALLATFLLIPLAALHAAAPKPNVVILLADDLGYSDVQCYNPQRGKIPTPNIDRLATQGMRFTDAHSSSGVCSPSRYTLLTGRYHWRTRLQSGIVPVFGDALIAPERLTIASLAKQHGYRKDARYDHRLHSVLLVASGMSCEKVASLFGDSPRTLVNWGSIRRDR